MEKIETPPFLLVKYTRVVFLSKNQKNATALSKRLRSTPCSDAIVPIYQFYHTLYYLTIICDCFFVTVIHRKAGMLQTFPPF